LYGGRGDRLHRHGAERRRVPETGAQAIADDPADPAGRRAARPRPAPDRRAGADLRNRWRWSPGPDSRPSRAASRVRLADHPLARREQDLEITARADIRTVPDRALHLLARRSAIRPGLVVRLRTAFRTRLRSRRS